MCGYVLFESVLAFKGGYQSMGWRLCGTWKEDEGYTVHKRFPFAKIWGRDNSTDTIETDEKKFS